MMAARAFDMGVIREYDTHGSVEFFWTRIVLLDVRANRGTRINMLPQDQEIEGKMANIAELKL
jgi:hypothetical protein